MHATKEDAEAETLRMLETYADFYENDLAIPVVRGRKTDKEKFAGAEATYTVEALMHDGKALQGGTSHYFGDGFAKAFDIKFTDKDNKIQYCYQTSWGVSTRMIGAIIMTHGDDNGLVLPPAVAPIQVVVIPVQQHKEGVVEAATEVYDRLRKFVRTKIDVTDNSPGWKFSEYEMKGVPLRLELGPRDIQNGTCVLVRRDTREKIFPKLDELETVIPQLLKEITASLYESALENKKARTFTAESMDELIELANTRSGYVKAMWCGDLECELAIKEKADLSSRCMPFGEEPIGDRCVCCGKPATKLVYWGKAY